MRNPERQHLSIADGHSHSGNESYELRPAQFVLIGVQRAQRAVSEMCLHGQIFHQGLESGSVIVVFVSNENGIDPIGILADHLQPPGRFLTAHACIDQKPHLFCPDESRVSAASASEHRYCHHSPHYVRCNGQHRSPC